jgi:hypothetical protein
MGLFTSKMKQSGDWGLANKKTSRILASIKANYRHETSSSPRAWGMFCFSALPIFAPLFISMFRGQHIALLLIMFVVGPLAAQLPSAITGVVKDAASGDRLPFCTIELLHSQTGTISNLKGEFDWKAPASLTDTLQFSVIGYHPQKIALQAWGAWPREIALEPSVHELDEVEFIATEDPRHIVAMALEAIKDNYPEKTHLLEAFYRETTMENGRYVSLLEAAIHIKDPGYDHSPLSKTPHEKVHIEEIRRSFNTEKYLTKKDQGTNFLQMMLFQNPIKYPAHNAGLGAFEPLLLLPESLVFEREPDQYLGDTKVYVIKARPIESLENYDPHYFKLYIHAVDFAFLQIDVEGRARDNILFEDPYPQAAALQLIYVHNTFRFRKVGNKYFPSFLQLHWGFQAVERPSGQLIDVFEYKKNLLVHTIGPAERWRGKQMKDSKRLDWQVGKYHPEFWEHYPLLKATPLEERIVRDLEREQMLEAQFTRKGKR